MGSTQCGSVHKPGECEGSRLLSEEGRLSGRARCPSPQVGLPFVLRLPSLAVDTKGTGIIQEEDHKLNPDRPLLGLEAVVLHPSEFSKGTDHGRSIGSRRSPPLPQTGGLVSEEDLLRRRGLSEKLISTLVTSRKKVTRAIYYKVWKC